MTATANKKYRATFILDLRGREESAEEVTETIKQELSGENAEIENVESLGSHSFARTPDRNFVSGTYVQVDFAAPPLRPAALQDRFRLNKAVNRILVESRD